MIAFQARVKNWILKCFGEDILLNKHERVRRFVEEAIELAQAAGLTKKDIADISDYVYSRPSGEVPQEIGGCGVTLLGIGSAYGLNITETIGKEIDRIESKPVEVFRKRNLEKSAAGIGTYGIKEVPKSLQPEPKGERDEKN